MGLNRLLLSLYPRDWRDRYGEEFAALLEDTPTRPAAVLDVLRHALTLRARAHRTALRLAVAALLSIGVELVSVRARLTANILWAPSTPERAVALAALAGPWLLLSRLPEN